MNGEHPADRDDWNRWRGDASGRIDACEDELLALRDYRNRDTLDAKAIEAALYEKINAVERRLISLETKVAVFCAVAAAAGGLLGQLIEWALSAPRHV